MCIIISEQRLKEEVLLLFTSIATHITTVATPWGHYCPVAVAVAYLIVGIGVSADLKPSIILYIIQLGFIHKAKFRSF